MERGREQKGCVIYLHAHAFAFAYPVCCVGPNSCTHSIEVGNGYTPDCGAKGFKMFH